MTGEVRADYTLCNRLGLHARAATALAQLVADYDAEVRLELEGQSARSTSVLELLMLCAQDGTRLGVVATGRQAREALDAVGRLIHERFGEPD